jgi:D-threonine aldolase
MTKLPAARSWYQINDPSQIDSPAILVFPERVKHNIQIAIATVGDVKRLRPHIKTCKSPDAVRLMQEAGITKFKCATISEAELLGMMNAYDVLLAYQPTGPKLKRFIELIKKYPASHYSCLTDSVGSANEIVNALQTAGLKISVYIDINVGMNRTGIRPGSSFIELWEYLQTNDSIENIGLHVYDGHITTPDFKIREQEVNDCYKQVDELLKEINEHGRPAPYIIAGGSPTFPVHAKRKNVECSPGTFIYWDKSYLDNCPEQNFLPAVVLMTRIISLPGNGIITTDLGHKSVASENDISRRVFLLNVNDLKPVSQSEEHLVLKNEGDKVYEIGDILYGIPFHVCPTVALYERMLTIENGKVSGEWKNTARDRIISV